MSSVQRLDRINFGLVILSGLLAHIAPVELLVIAYAFVGPAHYLTEMSWLHERRYFTKMRWDYLALGGLGSLVFITYDLGAQYIILVVAFFLAISMALLESWPRRIAVTVGGSFVTTILLGYVEPVAWFFVFLPNLIHIVVFTSIFILLGALRNNSGFGFATLGALVAVGATFFTTAIPSLDATGYGLTNILFIRSMYEGLFDLMQVEYNDPLAAKLFGFVAFMLTYHYLNWFSKTAVIRWHAVPKRRLALIGAIYLISIGLYAWDYALGFKAMLLLSFLHVVLEFPLNTVSVVETGRLIRARLRPG